MRLNAVGSGFAGVGGPISSPPSAMISVSNVEYGYSRRRSAAPFALKGLTLQLKPGESVGIAGPNGAGKSTLIALLLGYLRATAGSIRIDGLEPRKFVEREGVGYVPEIVSLPPSWTVGSALERFADLDARPSVEAPRSPDDLMRRFDLEDAHDKRLGALSKGTLQRVAIAQAFARDYRVCIFDEPTHGLDPSWRDSFRKLIRELRHPGRLVIIASHDLAELEQLTDRVVIMNKGEIKRIVGKQAARGQGDLNYRLVVTGVSAESIREVFPEFTSHEIDVYEVSAIDATQLTRGIQVLIDRGAVLSELTPTQSALERHFADVAQEARS